MAETNSQLALRRLRRDSRDEDVVVVGYENEAGKILAWTGDDEAPYVKVLSGGGSSGVAGLIAHDAADDEATNFPVKVGGHATSGIRTAVDANDDIADVSVDLNGRVRTRVSGTNESTNTPADVRLDSANALEVGGQAEHDTADKGFPLLSGMHANASPATAVSENDRARANGDLRGRFRIRVSGEANGAGTDVATHDVAGITVASMLLGVHDPSNAPTSSGTQALLTSYTAGAATSTTAKASAGRIYHLIVGNPSGFTLHLQVHNTVAAPGAGATPFITPITIEPNNTLILDFGRDGLFCPTGITVASSSVYATFTGSAGLHMTVLYQ